MRRERNGMKDRTWKRILKTERLSLYQAAGEPETFSVRWRKDVSDGEQRSRYGYRVFSAPTVGEAIRFAPFVCGFEQQPKANKPIPLVDAFDTAVKASRRGARAQYDWDRAVELFSDWLVEHHPRVGAWNQLSREIVREYAEEHAHLSPNRQRLLMQPIRQTDNYMAREYGFQHIAQGLATSSATVSGPTEVHLSDVIDLLAFLREHKDTRALEAPAALCGLAGMRISEAFRQRWENIDRERGLAQIVDGKTPWSNRVIPVAADVADALERAWLLAKRRKVRPVEGERVAADWSRLDTFGKAMSEAIRQWKAAVPWRGGDLRNAIPTWAKAVGRGGDPMIEEYIGHAPRGVTARHYAGRLMAVSRGEREDLDRRMEFARSTIIVPLEEAIEKAKVEPKKRKRKRAAK